MGSLTLPQWILSPSDGLSVVLADAKMTIQRFNPIAKQGLRARVMKFEPERPDATRAVEENPETKNMLRGP